MSGVDIYQAAELLYRAHKARVPISPLTERYPGLDLTAAYAVQQVNLGRRLHSGAWHKIGLTSNPMQDLLGVDEPDHGYLVDDMVLPDGATLAAARFCAPRVEPEVAFLLRKPSPASGRYPQRGPGVTVDEVRAATEAVAPALEIVDSRIADRRLTLLDTVADNASSGAVVLGGWVPYGDDIELPTARASLTLNATEIDCGFGSAVMGDPAVAVAWLANAVARFGTEIVSGQFVMSGSFTTAAFAHPGDRASTTISGLGRVSVTFE